jgi:Family of unknown function (DUF6158)
MQPTGVPAHELTDEELERQGTQAHATRNWVFLHGTAEQFAHHTERMQELEQEYLRRHPKRTWQGLEGTGTSAGGAGVAALLAEIAAADGGRVHRLELHQLARAHGVPPADLAQLYRAEPALLAVDGQDRCITAAGRARAVT